MYVDLTLYGYSKNLFLLYQFYSMNLSIKHLIVISMCLYALYGRIQVGVRPDIFLPITSQIIYVVQLMSGSCHARFLVVYDFSCPARVSLIPARFRLGVLFQLGSLPLCPVLLVFGQCYARVRLKCLAEFMLPFGQTFSYGQEEKTEQTVSKWGCWLEI